MRWMIAGYVLVFTLVIACYCVLGYVVILGIRALLKYLAS